METIKNFFNKYQLPIFFLLAYLLSWWSAPFVNGQIMPHGPAAAAVIVLAVTAGPPGLRTLWQRITHWRVAWYWFLVGPALIVFYQGSALLINLMLGATVANPIHLPAAGVFLELLLLGGLWEEPGWTGYALPKLQERFAGRPNGKLTAALVLGMFRAIWHLPLFFYGHIPWFDVVVFEIAFQLIIAWLYNRSGGSVLVVILFHFASNVLGAVFSPVFAGSERTTYYALFVGIASLIALAFYWRSGSLGKQVKTPSMF
jgi:hypothetical protein